MRDWDVITLIETWVGEKGWETIRQAAGRLCMGYAGKEEEQKGKGDGWNDDGN